MRRCVLLLLTVSLFLPLTFCAATSYTQSNNVVLNPDEREHDGQPHQPRQSIIRRLLFFISTGVSGWVVLMNSTLMSMANCLGALPFLFVKRLSGSIVGMANGIACGVMLACSFDLIHEGEPYGSAFVILGVLIGMICVKYCQAFLEKYEDVKFEAMQGADARKILLVLGIMAAHAVGEGAGVGVSYAGSRGWSQGLLVTLAIGLHNIPEGLAVATVLIARGVSIQKAMGWNLLVAIPQAIVKHVALPAYLFVEIFTYCLPLALGFAAGCMIWVVFSELLPDAFEHAPPRKVATAATLSAIWLEAMRLGLSTFEENGALYIKVDREWATITGLTLITACISISIAMIMRLKVTAERLKAVIGIGMQLIVAIALLMKEMIQSYLPTISFIAWLVLGIVLSIVDWRPAVDRLRRVVVTSNAHDHLPLTKTRSTRSTHTNTFDQLYEDPMACKTLCCLIGIGLIEGMNITQSIVNGYTLDRLFIPISIRSIIFGLMIGFWSLSLRCRTAVSIMMSTIVSIWPAIVILLTFTGCNGRIEIQSRLTALMIGSILMNTCRLMFSQPSISHDTDTPYAVEASKMRSETNGTITESKNNASSHSVFDSPGTSQPFKRPLLCRSGFFFGTIISLGSLSLLGIMCNWEATCL